MKPQTVTSKLVDDLIETSGGELISIFIPTHRRGRDVAQDPIRLKNAMAVVDAELEERGWKTRRRESHLAGVAALLEDREFWEHQSDGLAVYVRPDSETVALSLSEEPPQRTIVSSSFSIRPLLLELALIPLPTLVLTRGEVGYFLVYEDEAERLGVDLPDSMADVNWFVDREQQRQNHPVDRGSSRGVHGHDPADRTDEDVERFLRAVSAALPEYGTDGLCVLGDDELVARFADMVAGEILTKENSRLVPPIDTRSVHEMAVTILEDVRRIRDRTLIAKGRESLGRGDATTDLSEALAGAVSGRIDTLIVPLETEAVWGRLDASNLDVAVSSERRAGDVDLIEMLTIRARETGANVEVLAGDLPDHDFIALTRF